MPKFKEANYQQMQWIGVSFEEQILPGTFEHTLDYLIDNEVDLIPFYEEYKNDDKGAKAFNPAILLKIVLYAYSRGIVSSRRIAQACKNNIIFMALSANTRPHFTTIASFVSCMEEKVTSLFRDILLVCDEQGLIGRDMFAVDGCKLPSNASKNWSGTMDDLRKKAAKLETAIGRIVNKHKELDESQQDSKIVEHEKAKLQTLQKNYHKIKDCLSENDDRRGPTGNIVKSNITDNESAKMSTSHGVIQGYNGVAMVDSLNQVAVHGEAFGSGNEQSTLEPMVDGTRESIAEITDGDQTDVFDQAILTADAGFHSEANMKWLAEEEIDAYVADNQFRKRDPLFATASRHKPKKRQAKKFTPSDFTVDLENMTCRCPAGKPMYLENSNFACNKGKKAICFRGWKAHCPVCPLRAQCLRNPNQKTARQVHFFTGQTTEKYQETYTHKMKRKIDSPEGRRIYGKRLGTVEPVFGHICSMMRLNRFTLRGKVKVNTQWLLFLTVHNMKKLFSFADGLAYA